MKSERLKSAARVSSLHLGLSVFVAVLSAVLVFLIWFPGEFREMVGGRELFLLVIAVDVVCGPLLTLVLFNPEKSRRELALDMGMVGLMQMAALVYGVWTVWTVRPLYLVAEIDRFKVISAHQVDETSLKNLPDHLQRKLWNGPLTVGLRPLKKEERETVMFESVQGGRDYGERPEYFVTYDSAQALQNMKHAKSFENFLRKYPDQATPLNEIVGRSGTKLVDLRYLPIIARQDWIAVLNPSGHVLGYLKGDGF